MVKFETYLSTSLILSLFSFKSICSAEVFQLNSQNFDQITSQYELVFVNFYADWCRFSQILSPVFEEAYSTILKEFPEPNRVLFGKVDCENQGSLAAKFHISKYPTLKVFINNKVGKREYRGQRSVEAITNHIRDLLKDPVKPISTHEDHNNIEEKKGAIIGYFNVPPATTNEYITFRKVATDLKGDCNFYWVTGEPSISHLQAGKQNFIIFKPSRVRPGEQDIIYPGTLQSYDEFSTWSTDKCIPLVREITFENAEELTEEGLPFLILFHAPEDRQSVDLYTNIVHRELYSESSNINFLTADGHKFAHPLHHLGKTLKDLPLIAIDSFRHMYLFPNFNDINISGKLKQFIQDLHSGKLHREFHFGPDPANDDKDNSNDNQIITSPPESTFKKLAPSRNRYTLLVKDEL